MFELVFAYLASFGPFVLAGIGLGLALPLLLIVARPFRWIIAFGTLALCLVPFGGGNAASGAEGSLLRQVGWGSIFLVAAFLAMRGSDGRFQFSQRLIPPTLAMLLSFATLSVFWATNGQVAARRVLQVIGVFLIALSLVRHRNQEDVFFKFATPGLIFLLLGVAAIAMPSLSFGADGAFKGITYHKNTWGQFSALMGLIFLVQAIRKRNAALNWLLFGFATLSLLATRSATSVAIFALAASIICAWVLGRRYGQLFLMVCLVGLMIMTLATFGYFVFQGELPFERIYTASLDSVGKETTLTGRTALWQMMGSEIARHPWLGIGYGSFWLGLEGQSVTIVRFFSWQPGQAHSGYIDVVNELGYIGLSLLIATVVSHMTNLWRLYRADQGEQLTAVFHFAILAAALVLNISESSLLRTTHLWWIILTISIVEVHAVRAALTSTATITIPRVRPEVDYA